MIPKLVRDGVPAAITRSGAASTIVAVAAGDRMGWLMLKLGEEVDEFKVEHCPMELVDIYEVLRALWAEYNPEADISLDAAAAIEARGQPGQLRQLHHPGRRAQAGGMMTIGGIEISEARFVVLSRLLEQGQVAVKSINARTGSSLASLGLIEMFTPDAPTYAAAVRGLVRHYRLTPAGKEAIEGVKRKYNLEHEGAACFLRRSAPARQRRQRQRCFSLPPAAAAARHRRLRLYRLQP